MPCPFLEGDGSVGNPYLVYTFDEFMMIDLDVLASDDHDVGLYFKLMNNIDLTREKRKWIGVDLNYGYLDMNGFAIISPNIKEDSFMFRNTTIRSKTEVWNADGSVKTEGAGGFILNIKGTGVRSIFGVCSFDYIYVDANNVVPQTNNNPPLFANISSKNSSFRIHADNVRFRNNSPFTVTAAGMKDTRINYIGETRDYPLIKPMTEDTEITLDHCFITGYVGLNNMRYGAESSEVPLIDGTIKSCIFNIKSNRPDGDGGYRKYATKTSGVNVAIKSIHRDGTGINVGETGDVIEVEESVIRDPDELAKTGIDVLHYIEEGDGT